LKKIRNSLGVSRRLDALFILLILATVPLLAFVVIGALELIEHVQLGNPLFSQPGVGGFNVYAQLWTLISMMLFIVVGWGIWWIYQRRHLDQLRIRQSEHKYRNIINHAGEAIFLLNSEGVVLEWNKAAEALFGVPRRNVLGRRFRDIHLCYSVEIENAMHNAKRLKRSVASEFPLRLRGQQEQGQVSLTVTQSVDFSGIKNRGGRKVTGSNDNPDTYVIIARDITHEKQLETRISEAEKLAGIGQFAAGIAHQLNTPLGSILLSAQMLEDAIENEDDVEDVQRIIRQTEQCKTIIKSLLNFARPSGRSRSRCGISEIVQETIFLMDKTIRTKNVEINLKLEGEGYVFGNRNELEQVIFNLLANSLDVLAGGGEISITVNDSDSREVEVLFEDNGDGVAEEMRDQIFLPFFTTKEYGKGTGLGLPIVARIVHEHGGHIDLLDGPGARFLMTFPQHRPGVDQDVLIEDDSRAGGAT
jgi:PAS domain S-box-containing protein